MGGRAPVPEGLVDEIVGLWRSGLSQEEIAGRTGLHVNTVAKYIKQFTREKGGMTKAQVAQNMFMDGATIMEVVEATGMKVSRAREIRDKTMVPRPDGDELAIAVWRLHSRGYPPSRIDRELGIGRAREIITYEWHMDTLKRPSLVGSGV